ncbi:Di-/tripeptide transporter [Streptomyces hundungensis]|uniref:Di-/tripeptide transporter n=2 Tax=Streptomyces hundungensis TaxID=1077946 RepID=A0A387HK70_9ACTN|nr:Di-/tripeptide transporter [Streptomyces hundungensis]
MSGTMADAPEESAADQPPPQDDHAIFGQPRGLLTLSGLEVWERFSFLGMQAILPAPAATWAGLGLISAGTGLLKPNVASMVGKLYRTDDERRDAGFALPPEGMRRAVRLMVLGALVIAALAVLLASANAETSILGFHFPAGWYASALGAFEVALAPVVAAVWARTGPRQPHASNKIAFGVVLGGLSFLLMVPATSGHPTDTYRMAVWWIVGSYLLLGLGDVLLETSGMSATTKLAPRAFASQTMSLWFLSLALANGIQAQTVKVYGKVSNPAYFGVNGALAVAVGVAVILAAPWLKRTMHPVH